MQCRICHQPISFVRGRHPGHPRKATEAVHDSDLPEVLTRTNGEVVTPHAGAQRRLRQKMEQEHPPSDRRFQNISQASAQSQLDMASHDSMNRENLVMENLAEAGSNRMMREQEEYNSVSPELTAGDVDAAWQEAESSGDETPGSHSATPEQNNVDEIGKAFGIELRNNQEQLTHDEILARRDRNRWELNRNSADDESI